MDPNIKVMINTLRRTGKAEDALRDYCWAKQAVPVEPRREHHSPFAAPRATHLMAIARMMDAFDEGSTDERLEGQFLEGVAEDRKMRGIVCRPMRDDAKPPAGELIKAMSPASREKAAEIFGVSAVADLLVSK